MATTRIMVCLLLGTCAGLCQTPSQAPNRQNDLPDAPSVQTANDSETMRALIDTARLPVATAAADHALDLKYDPLHLRTDRNRTQATDLTAWKPSLLKPGPAFHGSTNNTLMGRATDAASSILFTREDDGKRTLNTPYLLRVLTIATAHVADRRYGRRTIGQPLSDFGSTIGNDAGMSVLHEFQPGLLQLVKSHEPRFVSRIEQRVRQK